MHVFAALLAPAVSTAEPQFRDQLKPSGTKQSGHGGRVLLCKAADKCGQAQPQVLPTLWDVTLAPRLLSLSLCAERVAALTPGFCGADSANVLLTLLMHLC
jgi:hypothetical protein